MTRTLRVLDVLCMFSDGVTSLTAQQITERLGTGRATAYRCIADLEGYGLIERSTDGNYFLGPTIVELDRRIRQSDPLLHAAEPVMQTLAGQVGGVVLLCRLHERKVLCVHQCVGAKAPPNVSYERGRAMPLYRGATSRAILAHLDRKRVESLVRDDPSGLAKAGLPTDVAALATRLADLRKQAVFHGVGEVDADAAGWAVPLHHGKQLLGSLSVVLDRTQIGGREGVIADRLKRAGLRIEGRLEGRRTAT